MAGAYMMISQRLLKYSKQVRETPVRLAQETEATDLFKQLQSSNFVSVCEQKVG